MSTEIVIVIDGICSFVGVIDVITMTCLENVARDPMFITSLSVKAVLLTFHVSVLACILQQRAKGISSFRSGFFTIYVLQSAADLSSHVLVSVLVCQSLVKGLGRDIKRFNTRKIYVF